MTRVPSRPNRRGLTLLEVVVSMALLLAAIVALTQLISNGSARALEVQQQALGTLLAERKLAEVTVGATPLSSTGYTAFDEDGLDNWEWKLDATQGTVNGLWNVQVSVRFTPPGSEPGMEVHLGQMVLDPTLRGSTLDPPPAAQNTDTSSSSSSSSSGSPSSGSPSSGSPSGGSPSGSNGM